MKRLTFFLLSLVATTLLSAQSIDSVKIKAFVESNIGAFPKSTLQDIFKSFYQAVYGPEHLVTDSAKVIAYIEEELKQDFDNKFPTVQYLGISDKFVRVNLDIIGAEETRISTEMLADCFMRSSQTKGDMPIEEFRSQWRLVVDYFISSDIQLDNFSQDSLYIESILAKGRYVWVHSPQYKAAYKPHYRVVSREIFEKEIQPLLMKSSRLYIVPDNRPPVKKKE